MSATGSRAAVAGRPPKRLIEHSAEPIGVDGTHHGDLEIYRATVAARWAEIRSSRVIDASDVPKCPAPGRP